MRRAPTEGEGVLWHALRRGAVGAHFRRQHVIGRFVVDFCCIAAKLIVEVDGGIHEKRTDRDETRDDALSKRGYRVLRFSNDRVFEDLTGVLDAIRNALTGNG